MKNDKIPFDSLRKLLLDCGFVESTVPGPYLLFEHSPSGTLFPYRAYQAGDGVSWADLVMTRTLLDERGIMDAEVFDEQLHKAPV